MFRQVWARVQKMVQAGRESEAIPEIEVFHMGACLRCGRALTTPESITRGLGPDCAERE
jgi:UDP-N-acetylglucosamine 2-epimerase